ncbi:MAG TPA: hypothetical protein VLB82_07050 [Thermodesulfobacteriota bacterium]|nr:hypothetical protein [Thermodesulfobacteriota bacterium]
MEQFKFACTSLAVFALLSVSCLAQQPESEAEQAESKTQQPVLQDDKTLSEKKYDLFKTANFIHINSQQVEKWHEELPDSDNPNLADKIIETEVAIERRKEHFKELTNIDYTTHEDFFSWWEENADYLEWIISLNKLAVNEEAKSEGTVLNHFKYVFELEGWQYWSFMAQNRVKESRQSGEFIKAYVHNKGSVRVKKSQLEDPLQKERGYKDAADILINKKLITAEEHLPLIELLTKFTGEKFEDYSAWVFWWDTNKNRLKLNEEGTRLIVNQ